MPGICKLIRDPSILRPMSDLYLEAAPTLDITARPLKSSLQAIVATSPAD